MYGRAREPGLSNDFKVDSWASMSNSNSAINPSAAVVLKVKDGYAQDTAALLQKSYEQVLSYTCDDLIHNAGRRLQAAFHTFYRIAVMLQ